MPRGDRTNVVIEPMLTDQWFVAMSKPGADGKSITEKALEAVHSGEIKFYPENWVNTYNQWLNNIQDWCISRQLWWGHQIPAWYGDNGQVFVAQQRRSPGPGRSRQGKATAGPLTARRRRARHLVLLRPVAVLDPGLDRRRSDADAGPTERDLQQLSALLVLVTGFDIIFFWVARMVMMTKHITGKIPFKPCVCARPDP